MMGWPSLNDGPPHFFNLLTPDSLLEHMQHNVPHQENGLTFVPFFGFCNLLKYFWSLPARGLDNHGCRNLPRGPCLRWPKNWISNQLFKQNFVQLQLLSGHPTSSSLWSLFLDWFNYVYDIIFIQSSTLLRFCRENNVWGFHLLFPFNCWPNSKAMMSEEERGETSIDIYSYIYIKMDLVQVTSSNVLIEQSRIRSTINESYNWCHKQKLISKCSWKVAPPGRMQAVTWNKF